MSSIGLPEIAIVLLIVLVIFGPKRLPQLGRSLGGGMREFKDAVTGKTKDEDEHEELPPSSSAPVTNATSNTDETSSTAKTADAS
jgi:sec-independent protein translocase protein TatA